MKQVTFKTLDTATVHEKLIGVGERIAVVSEVIDKWNDCETCSVLPILKDAGYELSEVYSDLKLNGQGKQLISKEQEKRWQVEYMEQLEERLAKVKAEIEADEIETPTD